MEINYDFMAELARDYEYQILEKVYWRLIYHIIPQYIYLIFVVFSKFGKQIIINFHIYSPKINIYIVIKQFKIN